MDQRSNVYMTIHEQLGKMDGSQLELETIKRKVEDEFQDEFAKDDATELEKIENEDTVENEVQSVGDETVNAEEVNNNVISSVITQDID